jgi:hypothetical protein
MPRQVPWIRVVAEGTAIVVSILLAFGVQAWWEGRQERADELASLRLIDRDITAAIAQLREYNTLVEGSLAAAVSAYRALSGPPDQLERESVSQNIVRAAMRRTVALPSAAYTDLVSTGNLRLLSDPRLRDEIVRFYASAERAQTIIERNNTALIDGMFWTEIFGRGIVLNRPGLSTGVGMADQTTEGLREALGDGVVHGSDPLWDLPPGSTEWNTVRGTLLVLSRAAVASSTVAGETIEAALDLQANVRASIEAMATNPPTTNAS